MKKRQAITDKMKLDCLLYRCTVKCGICGDELYPNDEIEWDHIQALVHSGAHVFTNIRPGPFLSVTRKRQPAILPLMPR
jgi:uncharacterized protein YuzB (UPF0349 family)